MGEGTNTEKGIRNRLSELSAHLQYLLYLLDDACLNDHDQNHLLTKDIDSLLVPGRIHFQKHVEYWVETFKLSTEIRDLLQFGYVPPLLEWPPRSDLGDNKSARDPSVRPFLSAQIATLEKVGAIVKTSVKPRCVLPLQVVHREGKEPRLVIDASRQINPYIAERRVRLSTLKIMNEGVEVGDWWSSLDLKSGYYHIKIHPDYRQLFGIRWTTDAGKEVFYIWRVCFLGISDLVYTFTKVLRPIMRHLHELGIKSDIYIDDLRVVSPTREKCSRDMNIVRSILFAAGFVEAKSKAVEPTQSGVFLGLINDFALLRYSVPESKLISLILKMEDLMKHKRAKIKTVASLYGCLSACSMAVGPSLRLLTRLGQKSYSTAAAMFGWDGWMDVQGLKGELLYLHNNLRHMNGFPFDGQELRYPVDTVLASDASNVGFGVIRVRCGGLDVHTKHNGSCEQEMIVKQSFSISEASESSTLREMLAIRAVYTDHEISDTFRGKGVTHLTDNQGAASIMKIGSPSPNLQKIALEIFRSCQLKDIRLRVHWRPRHDPRLEAADARSRHFDNEDWGPDYDGFLEIEAFASETFSIDLFATYENRKCDIFASKFGAERHLAAGINAFTLDWNLFGYFYACPPPRLIVPILKQVAGQKCKGVLIVPFWPASHFWAFLFPDGIHLCNMVQGFMRFRPRCLVGPEVKSHTFQGKLKFDLLALEMNGRMGDPFRKCVSRYTCLKNGCPECSNK